MTDAATEKRALLCAYAIFGLFWGSWVVLLPALKLQVGLSDGQLGLELAAIALSALPSMPLAGRLVDRYGIGRFVRYALLVFAIVAPLPSLVHGRVALIPLFVLIGLTTGFLDVVLNAATAAWERTESQRLMAGAHGLFSGGTLVGSVCTGFARDLGATPVRVLPVVGLLIALVALRQPPYRGGDRESPVERSRLAPTLLLIGLLIASAFLVEDALQSWSALHLERDLGAPPWVSGLGPGLFALSMTAGRLGSHALGAGHRDGVVLGAGGLAVAAGAVLLAVAPVPLVGLIALFLAGAGTSVLAPTLLSAVGARSDPGRQGAALSNVTTLGYLGFLIGPPIVGLISAATSLPVALGLLGVVGLLLSIVGPVVLRTPARSLAELP